MHSFFSVLSRFNPRSPCGERHLLIAVPDHAARVSTHAPLAGSDFLQLRETCCGFAFQPTLPLRGATITDSASPAMSSSFQPTLPLRGATMTLYYGQHFFGFQPTLPLRGATRPILSALSYRDTFQPTLPLRGATGGFPQSIMISS